MSTYTYDVVKWYGFKKGRCAVCGKPAERSRCFQQTLNPFNRDTETGAVKTLGEIDAELRTEARAWEQEPILHARCEVAP